MRQNLIFIAIWTLAVGEVSIAAPIIKCDQIQLLLFHFYIPLLVICSHFERRAPNPPSGSHRPQFSTRVCLGAVLGALGIGGLIAGLNSSHRGSSNVASSATSSPSSTSNSDPSPATTGTLQSSPVTTHTASHQATTPSSATPSQTSRSTKTD
jgi:hypothetical protein